MCLRMVCNFLMLLRPISAVGMWHVRSSQVQYTRDGRELSNVPHEESTSCRGKYLLILFGVHWTSKFLSTVKIDSRTNRLKVGLYWSAFLICTMLRWFRWFETLSGISGIMIYYLFIVKTFLHFSVFGFIEIYKEAAAIRRVIDGQCWIWRTGTAQTRVLYTL